VADPGTGVIYVTSRKACTARIIASGEERDPMIAKPTGATFSDYAALRPDGVRGPDDLPLFKPPYSRITAIDMNSGEHLWWIPVGETPEVVLNHPDLKGMKIDNTGTGRAAPMTVTSTMLIYAAEASDDSPHLYAVDKASGKQLGKVAVPERSSYGMMTYVHKGKQYIILQTGPRLTAMAIADF
jgi:quinoprotein glucose dehydrogenase